MPTPEQKLVEQMRRSRYWRWISTYLADRRDTLIAETPTNTTELAMNKGALQEVCRLMRGPDAIVAFLAAQEKEDAAQAPQTTDDHLREFFASEAPGDGLVD